MPKPVGAARIGITLGLAAVAACAAIVAVALLRSGAEPQQAASAPSSAALLSLASSVAGQDDPAYRVSRAADGLRARNARHGLTARFDRSGTSVSAAGRTLRLSVAAVGRGAALAPVGKVAPTGDRNRVEFVRPSLTEWYTNGPLGLEHGFTLDRRPVGAIGNVRVLLETGGALASRAQRHGDGVLFGGLAYRGVAAWDDTGRDVPVQLSLRGRTVEFSVDDTAAVYPLTIDPFLQLATLSASDGAPGAQLGFSLATSGDTVVVGAPGAGTSGAAYVFVRPGGGWATATQTAKLSVAAATAGDGYGSSVAISGDTVVVGADELISGTNGAAYVFVRPGGGWATTTTPTAKLTAAGGAAGDTFGQSVAISGDTVVVGAPTAASLDGTVHVYMRPGGGWVTTSAPAATLTDGTGSGARLGSSVATSGDVIAAGAPSAAGGGAVDVYVRPGASWASATTPTATLSTSGTGSLGMAVALTSTMIAAGAPSTTVSGNPSRGAVYVFAKPGGGWATMSSATARLTASDGAAADGLGGTVAATDDVVVSGSDNATVGANPNQGAAYAWVRGAAAWADATETSKLVATGGAAFAGFGYSVAFAGDAIVVGEPGSGNGSAIAFSAPPGAPTGATATAGVGQVAVTWAAPTLTGSAAVTGYTVTADPGGATCTTTGATSCTVTGLVNGTTYAFTVRATGSGGTSAPSAAASAAPFALSCAAGTYASGSSCIAAPAGSFVATAGATSATQCAPGTFQPSQAQTSCIPAPAGTYATGPGATRSVLCAAETAMPFPGNPLCLPCPAGSSTLGRTGQLTCDLLGPGAPRNVRVAEVERIDTAADVSFAPPVEIEGIPVDRYTVTASPGNITATGTASPIRVTGLTVGRQYRFTVVATRVPPSASPVNGPAAAAAPYTAAGPPDQPVVTARAGDRRVTLFIARPDGNGAPVTSYTIVTPSGRRVVTPSTTSATTPVLFTGLENGARAYSSVTAQNRRGSSRARGGFVIPFTVAGAPTAVTVTSPKVEVTFSSPSAGKKFAGTVAFTPPTSNGGFPITGYVVTVNPGGREVEGTASPIVVKDLAYGTAYTFSVSAVTQAGRGLAGRASATIAAVPDAPMPLTVTTTSGGARITLTRPDFDGGAAITGYQLLLLNRVPSGTALKTLDELDALDSLRLSASKAEADGFTLDDLAAGEQVTVLVRAQNRAGFSFPAFAFFRAVVRPGPPTDVRAVRVSDTAGDSTIRVSYTAPADTGGAEIDGYEIRVAQEGQPVRRFERSGTSEEAYGLANGTTYSVTVVAIQERRSGSDEPGLRSEPSAAVTVTTGIAVPSAPSISAQFPDDRSALLTVVAPRYDGGAPITGYRVRAFAGSTVAVDRTATVEAGKITVTGLTNGTAYTFDVAATNRVGTGAFGPRSGAVTPRSVPGQPYPFWTVTATGRATIAFLGPLTDGGSPVTGYIATARPASGNVVTARSTTTPIVIDGLTDGVEYTITISAVSAFGVGTPSSPVKATVGPLRAGVPRNVTATPLDGRARLTFSAPESDGGSPVTGYSITVSPGGRKVTATASPFEVTGLTNGTTYTFTVAAVTRAGDGATAATPAVTPAAPASAPRDVVVDQGQGTGVVAVTFRAPESDGGVPIQGYKVLLKPKCGGCQQSTRDVGSAGTHEFGGFDAGIRIDAVVWAVTSVGNGASASTGGRLLGQPNLAVSGAGHSASLRGGRILDFTFSANVIVYSGAAAAPRTGVEILVRDGSSDEAVSADQYSVAFVSSTYAAGTSPCDLSNKTRWRCNFPSDNGSYTFRVSGTFELRNSTRCSGQRSRCNALFDMRVIPLVDDLSPGDNRFFAQAVAP